jgi:enoyl-CoA hydratase/carnithine racemase
MFELTRDGEIAWLRLNRPEVRNAVPFDGWAEIGDLVDRSVADGARALLLAGIRAAPFARERTSATSTVSRQSRTGEPPFRLAIRSGLDRLRDAPIPTIAVIEGPAYGAGLALAMACDVRLAGPGARLAATPAKLGISYPQEDVHRLVSLVGPGQAARLLLGAGTVDGPEAARIGLVELYLPAGIVEQAVALASQMAGNDPDSLRDLKRGIGLAAAGLRSDPEQDRSFDALLGSKALSERLAKFRKPR